ncbi:MAG TPA: ISL3 family transposase, partial [Acetobacteraceae bacterium]
MLLVVIAGLREHIEGPQSLQRKPFLSKRVLPFIPAGLVVDQVLPTPDYITIIASPRPDCSPCPTCAQSSNRVHSRYRRSLGDLPWQGRPVTLQVRVRRFRCLNPACPRQTFAERLAGTAPAAARRTTRLGDLQCHVGLALGGEAGMRLADRLAMPTSADTLLRLVCKAGRNAKPTPTPRVLAVDDWAWRRGHRYGTVLVDLERNEVVDLLPDRQADTLAGWLGQHPGVEIGARDRAGAYGDGIRQGAPGATQVADRWHLLRNLGSAVRAVVDRQHAAVRRAAKQVSEQVAVPIAPAAAPNSIKPTAAARRSQAAHARRQVRYEEAARLHAVGISITGIAAQLGAERKTIRGWLRAGGAPLWRKPPRMGTLAPHRDYLERRWAEGCRNAALLWRELVQLGFSGRPGTVRRWAGPRRESEPQAAVGKSSAGAATGQSLSGRQIARMLMADTDALSEAERALISALLAQVPGLATGVAVAKRLNRLLRRESQENLDRVLDDAAGTPLAEFAASMRRDLAAVQAALDLPWTTSPA